jgi:hypothetical protein
MTMTRTGLGVMSSEMTYETTTSNKEQVRVIIRETGESIKSIAIHRHEHWSREHGMLIEFHPVGVVVIG